MNLRIYDSIAFLVNRRNECDEDSSDFKEYANCIGYLYDLIRDQETEYYNDSNR